MEKFDSFIAVFIADQEGLSTIEYAIAGGLLGSAIILGFSGMAFKIAEIVSFVALVLASIVI